MSSDEAEHTRLLNESLLTIKSLRSELARLQSASREPIAVIGVGCRFPGDVSSLDGFWALLERGADAITEIPADRWDSDAYFDPNPDARGKVCTRFGGFVSAKDAFDPQFFRISPREAMYMDPQQRLLLEVAWETIEHAGIPSDALYGSDTGVFVGVSVFDFANLVARQVPEADVDHSLGTGCALSAASGRLSYVLGLKGPSIALDTACSSSLVAVHAACESLRRQECRSALAGGVSMILSPLTHIVCSRARMLAQDGRCKTFDESADGYVRSEGAGLLLLKRLSDALADGDNIWAVIRGGAVNQDGASGGFTVPNGRAQQQVIRKALANAGVEPADVDYIEAHGTGTALGDPIEINALNEIFRASHSQTRPLRVGSVKTNVGHMEAAAGIGGLIKVIVQLQKGALAPHLHFKQPSSRIPWSDIPIKVPTSLQPWPATAGRTRVAGVSSFGFTGTNAHLVVEEAPSRIERESARPDRTQHVLALSARTEPALSQLAGSYSALLHAHPDWAAGDVGYSANTGRSHFVHRVAIVGASTAELSQKLNAFRQRERPVGVFSGAAPREQPRVAYLFSGEGSPYAGMGRELYETQPVFRDVLQRCDRLVRDWYGWSVVDAMYPANGHPGLAEPACAQPLVVALECALAALWRSWGIEPSVVMGYGIGEYAAAAVAGVFTVDDALHLAAERGRLVQALPPGGGMVAVRSTEERLRDIIEPYRTDVSVAAICGPRHVVLSGAAGALRQIVLALDREAIRTKELDVSHALYSPLMNPMLADFAAAAARTTYAAPQSDMVSSVTADLAPPEMVTSPEYWVRHVVAPVRFRSGIEAVRDLGCTVFLEVGPAATLVEMGRPCLDPGVLWLASLRPDRGGCDQVMRSLAEMYVHGVGVDWAGVDRGCQRRRLTLPTYPFQRQQYWFASPPALRRAV
jgi:acyl transferase domain-containing protein